MTSAAPLDAAAWTVLLPAGAVWLSRLSREAGVPDGPVAVAPWSLRSRLRRGVRAYIAVPSRQRPLIVASWDRSVLRYLADTVLSVPPGTGPVLSLVLTAGLRVFRHPRPWLLAVALGGGVLVGRPQ